MKHETLQQIENLNELLLTVYEHEELGFSDENPANNCTIQALPQNIYSPI